GAPGSALRRATKLAQHMTDMRRLQQCAAARADVVHFQWLALQWLDAYLLPRRPTVLTAHDLLPREPRPGQARAQRRLYDRVDALIVHSQYGRGQLVDRLGVEPGKVHVIHHGAFDHLTRLAPAPLAPGLAQVRAPVVLFFGLLRPYKGIEGLLEAWRGVDGAELWVVGRPRMALEPLRAMAPPGTRFVPRFVPDPELAAYFGRADVVVLPYVATERLDFSGVLATALAFGKPIVLSDVGGLGEVGALGAARVVAPEDVEGLRSALRELIADRAARERLGTAALAAARGLYSWDAAALQTLALYRSLV
ncbi:MAG: glycosyltransferase family 4 protein, partial [Actinomycetota bacterium]|nr:glycosyltransferase family 4 protein [Actinomycetota bacterium]